MSVNYVIGYIDGYGAVHGRPVATVAPHTPEERLSGRPFRWDVRRNTWSAVTGDFYLSTEDQHIVSGWLESEGYARGPEVEGFIWMLFDTGWKRLPVTYKPFPPVVELPATIAPGTTYVEEGTLRSATFPFPSPTGVRNSNPPFDRQTLLNWKKDYDRC